MGEDDRVDITHNAEDVIDKSRYAVTFGALSEVVTLRWLNSDQGSTGPHVYIGKSD